MRFGYNSAGFAGAIVGLNIAIAVFHLNKVIDIISLNFMNETLGFLLIGGFVLDVYLSLRKRFVHSIVWLPILVLVLGFFMELVTYGSLAMPETYAFFWVRWVTFASFTIVFLGMPSLFLTNYLRKHKKVLWLDVEGLQGLVITFLANMLLIITLTRLLLDYHLLTQNMTRVLQ